MLRMCAQKCTDHSDHDKISFIQEIEIFFICFIPRMRTCQWGDGH